MQLRSGIEIKVGTWLIKVLVVPNLYQVEEVYGDWDGEQRIIRVAGDICHQDQAQTLLHELFHAASSYSALDFSEQTVVALENFFSQLLIDFPPLTQTLLDGIRLPHSPPKPPTGGPKYDATPDTGP